MLKVDTRFKGTRHEPGLKGSITDITTENLTPAVLVAGFLNGIVQELFDFYLQLPGYLQKNIKTITGSGNAVRLNPLLAQIIEEKFQRKLELPRVREEASAGAAKSCV